MCIIMSDSVTSGGKKGYKPLRDQVEELKRAIRLANTGALKAAEKECKGMEHEVSNLVTSQGKLMSDKTPLSVVLKIEGERCEGKLKQLEEECRGHSVNRKAKTEMKELKDEHDKCCRWLFLWNGAINWMKEDDMDKTGDMVSIMEAVKELKEENKRLEDKMKDLTIKSEGPIKRSTPNIYPWATLTPSAPPPPYVMPVMTLEGGEVRGPDGQTGSVRGGVVNVEYISGPVVDAGEALKVRECQPFSDSGRPEASAADAGPTSPRGELSAGALEQPEGGEKEEFGQIGEKDRAHTQEEVQALRALGARPKCQRQISPGEDRPSSIKKLGAVGGTPDWERWEGEVHGHMHDEPQALWEAFRALDEVRHTILRGISKDSQEKVISDEEEENEDAERGIESDPGQIIALRNREVRKEGVGIVKRRSMFKLSKGKAKVRGINRGPADRGFKESNFNLPLMAGPCGEAVYRAYKVRDLEALIKQLPPVTDGGASWLRKLATLTEGEELGLGDFRGIGGRCFLGGGLADIERLARTTAYANDLPLCEVQNALFNAVREKYPTRNAGAIPKIIWDPKDTPGEFLAKAKEKWLTETGIHPGREGEGRAWFRSAVLSGLPKQVKADLEKNPDFAVAEAVQWERHVVHRLQEEQDLVNKQKKELEEAQAQLLRLQLGEAREKIDIKKKEQKAQSKTIMVSRPETAPAPEWPAGVPYANENDHWPANALRQRRPAGNWVTGESQRGRGGYGRGGLRARTLGSPGNNASGTYVQPNNDRWRGCFLCGEEGHWVRQCPEAARIYAGRGYPTQARGNNRGGAAYRGAHQAPNPSAAPVTQYPVADWGREGEQY